MLLLKQPNRWSCSITALAMILNESVFALVQEIGHDGSEIIFPDAPEPTNRRGFLLDELMVCCWKRKATLSPYNRIITVCNPLTAERRTFEHPDFWKITLQSKGLITAYSESGKGHLVAWDGSRIYDPTGPTLIKVSDFKLNIGTFYRFFQNQIN